MASSSQPPVIVEPIEVPDKRPSLDESQASSPHDEKQAKPEPQAEYVTGRPLYLVLIGVLLSIFLIAIDQTIVANALPHIASVFNALPQLAWIPTSFLLTQTAFLLIFGQLPLLFPSKWVFTWALFIFELGSLLSGVATSINFLIFARAFQGVGAAGIFVSAISMVADLVPLETRPKFFGAFGGVFAVSSIIGPLLGGAFVQHVSWRWCFYINLPLSVPTFAAILFCIKAKPPPGLAGQKASSNEVIEQPSDTLMGSIMLSINNFFRKMAKLDWLGATLVLGFTTCLVLALQWGGNTKPWNSGDVIATFVVFGVLLVLFILWQFYKGDRALLPLHLFNSMTVVGCCICAFFTRMAFFMAIYYSVKGHSALKSGIDLIPLVLAVVFTSGIGGLFWHLLFFGPMVGAVCYGVLFTINEHTSWGKLIGLQIGVGIGVGCTLQNTILGVQATVRKDMIPQSSALVTFSQFIGGVLGATIFQNKLASGLHEFAPDAPYGLLRQSVEAIATLPPDQKAGAIHAYVEALKLVFVSLGVTTSALCSISTLLIKDINLRTLARERAAAAGEGKEEKKEKGEAMV
ncbi:hypothetical protein BOTBODRAFT_34275 [Botryobasidium botryosum FD-172 SS1]|uniref:Major facilitator superfamily (MFS) profile domain-containing protein n=1 Tax=Botryobasidium botryosum (strain FD-172 SS1) TaxID=930990 RepID=A0A067MMQ7_BOTB1|nr:hypothetical protein BOTBODRAFT_34275 [Botryobasidium botryosum FD-172 SS1]